MSYGASKEEWSHFSSNSEILPELLPVASNPELGISHRSSLKSLGKTPSLINKDGLVCGIARWGEHHTTLDEVEKWAGNPDLGICIQTRIVRAIDVDITDEAFSEQIRYEICKFLGFVPHRRYREGSPKFLIPLRCYGERRKQVVKTQHGIIEFLANGQQFVAAGAHIDKDGVSRSRYLWHGGLPTEIQEVDGACLDNLIEHLQKKFGLTQDLVLQHDSVSKAQKLLQAIADDPVAKHLHDEGWVKSQEKDGRLHVRCPWEDDHSAESAESSSTYFPAHTGGYVQGHFNCLHAHCNDRTDEEFQEAIGYADQTLSDGFPDLTQEPEVEYEISAKGEPVEVPKKRRFCLQTPSEFVATGVSDWYIKDIIPKADLIFLNGRSTGGKTFVAIDMSASSSLGTTWRGKRVKKAKVVYVVAEGASGFRNRMLACAISRGLPLSALDGLLIISDAPNLSLTQDVNDLHATLKGLGVDILVVDTLARATVGANENSAEEMGLVLRNCQKLSKALSATLMFLHHEGKDASKGGRGSTALKAAADAEIQVFRGLDAHHRGTDERAIVIQKMKDGDDEADPMDFRLDKIVVGLDDYGDPVTSCCLDHGGK